MDVALVTEHRPVVLPQGLRYGSPISRSVNVKNISQLADGRLRIEQPLRTSDDDRRERLRDRTIHAGSQTKVVSPGLRCRTTMARVQLPALPDVVSATLGHDLPAAVRS